jgi:hypothetical protein
VKRILAKVAAGSDYSQKDVFCLYQSCQLKNVEFGPSFMTGPTEKQQSLGFLQDSGRRCHE